MGHRGETGDADCGLQR